MSSLRAFPTFFRESWHEVVHKVTWPGLDEIVGTTTVVLLTTLAFAIFLGIVDLVMLKVMTKLVEISA